VRKLELWKAWLSGGVIITLTVVGTAFTWWGHLK
jgi:hypothetical protein